jgi:hypothetical protein
VTEPSNNQKPHSQATANNGAKQAILYIKKVAPPGYILLFGVILPAVTLGFELYYRACGLSLFDPIPTIWHVLLIVCVPAANLLVWINLYNQYYQKWLIPFNGLAMGIAAFYAVLFIPLTPIAFLTSWLGIGLLPLSPLLACIACIIGHFKLRKLAKQQELEKIARLRWGLMTALALLVLLQLPLTLTNFGLKLAASNDAHTQQRGIALLRSVGDRETMLRACYIRSGSNLDMVSFLLGFWNTQYSTEDARKIYYRVTGESFNSMPQPQLFKRSKGRWFGAVWDNQMGSDSIGGKVKDLWLTSSILDGSVSGDSGVAYLEWTLVFKNLSQRNAEARAHIELPPNAVVSRLTLWVNGEEREAAFAGRHQTRQAYQQVVRRQRDPVLVTTAGKDTVMMQMFPVPVNGEMKARIGITMPLQLLDDNKAILALPYLKESNFLLADNARHEVWLESKSPLAFNHSGPGNISNNNGVYRLTNRLTDEELADPAIHIMVESHGAIKPVVAMDEKFNETKLVRQSVEQTQYRLNRLVLVLDTSATMNAVKKDIIAALDEASMDMELQVIIAGDEVKEVSAGNTGDTQRTTLGDALDAMEFKGGRDNVPALRRAWELASQQPDSAILWVHGPQPVELQSAESLRHGWERDSNGPLLFDLQVANGRNHIMEKLDGVSKITKAHRRGPLGDDFKHWLAVLGSGKPVYKYHRQVLDSAQMPAAGEKASMHIVRLWACDEIMRLLSQDNYDARSKAIALATTYQLVTPVSGAVVLENQAQYDQAGLEPVEPGSVPTIPEPETWAMLIIALVLLAAVVHQHGRSAVGRI